LSHRGGEGIAFELRPPATKGGAWIEHRLWNFGYDKMKPFGLPCRPAAALIFGSNGTLMGTAYDGGAYLQGAVVQLTPPVPPEPPGHLWTMTDLHDFFGGSLSGDVGEIASSLAVDANGVMYGTGFSGGPGGTFGTGGVFSMTPPATPGGSWTEAYLYGFSGGSDGASPEASLVIDAAGNLYGTTSAGGYNGYGTVFEMIAPATPGGSWGEATINEFFGTNGANPQSTLIFGPGGVLYGTTVNGGDFNNGVVFQLTPSPGGDWTETVLYSFTGQNGDGANPWEGVVANSSGALFGTTYNGGAAGMGTIFQLTPPATPGGAWTETVLHNFAGQPTEGANPRAVMVFDQHGVLYGTTAMGGTANFGTVFKLKP
jgi:uncharacterized repeat protein (TIGR03803 family)